MLFIATRRSPVTLLFSALLVSSALSGCAVGQRLTEVGDAPGFSPINVPVTTAAPVGIQTAHAPQGADAAQYQPHAVPQQTISTPSVQSASATNSLWQPGSRSFFRDPRASHVGDILTVQIAITNSAQMADNTTAQRQSADQVTLPSFFGASSTAIGLANGLAKQGSTSSTGGLVNATGNTSTTGTGSIQRSETITTTVAAVVQQVLPNGNLVIDGRQEVRVNDEMRELTVSGIVRPEDIANTNTISQAQIAEARISYGGRGLISDVQKPGIGQQILNLISPF